MSAMLLAVDPTAPFATKHLIEVKAAALARWLDEKMFGPANANEGDCA